MPTVMMDYGFVSRDGEEGSLTILVMKDRDSRIIMADVAQRKGMVVEAAADQAVDNILRFGTSWGAHCKG